MYDKDKVNRYRDLEKYNKDELIGIIDCLLDIIDMMEKDDSDEII